MNMEPTVIFEDKNVLVINKPSGLQVHAARVNGAVRHGTPTLVDWLLAHYPEIKNVGDDTETRPGIVHRLDKATSGIMLVPKTQHYFLYLKNLFATSGIKKTYEALVVGVPKKKEGTIDLPIGIVNGTMKRSVRSQKMAKTAVTEYKTKKSFYDYALLGVKPKTGRTHQIRVHLAHMGNPIVGDPLYGRKKQPEWATRLMLHALSVEFTSEEGKRVVFEADPPQDFKEIIEQAAGEGHTPKKAVNL